MHDPLRRSAKLYLAPLVAAAGSCDHTRCHPVGRSECQLLDRPQARPAGQVQLHGDGRQSRFRPWTAYYQLMYSPVCHTAWAEAQTLAYHGYVGVNNKNDGKSEVAYFEPGPQTRYATTTVDVENEYAQACVYNTAQLTGGMAQKCTPFS